MYLCPFKFWGHWLRTFCSFFAEGCFGALLLAVVEDGLQPGCRSVARWCFGASRLRRALRSAARRSARPFGGKAASVWPDGHCSTSVTPYGRRTAPLWGWLWPNEPPNFLDQLDILVWKIDKNISGSALSLLCLSLALLWFTNACDLCLVSIQKPPFMPTLMRWVA